MCALCPEANGIAVFIPGTQGRPSRSFRVTKTCTTRKKACTVFRHKCPICTCLKGKSCPPVPNPVPIPSFSEGLQDSAVARRTPRHLGFLLFERVYKATAPCPTAATSATRIISSMSRPDRCASQRRRPVLPVHGPLDFLALAHACSNGRKSSPECRTQVSETLRISCPDRDVDWRNPLVGDCPYPPRRRNGRWTPGLVVGRSRCASLSNATWSIWPRKFSSRQEHSWCISLNAFETCALRNLPAFSRHGALRPKQADHPVQHYNRSCRHNLRGIFVY